MGIQLFELDNGKIKASIHCETMVSLKNIKKKYPKDYLNIYTYLFYMSCLNEDENPFANVPEDEKEDIILKEVGGNFSVDEEAIANALVATKKLYETTTYNFYRSMKIALENLAAYFRTTPPTDGRDGNIKDVISALKNFRDLKESFNGIYKEFKEEQNSTIARGGSQLAYDQ